MKASSNLAPKGLQREKTTRFPPFSNPLQDKVTLSFLSELPPVPLRPCCFRCPFEKILSTLFRSFIGLLHKAAGLQVFLPLFVGLIRRYAAFSPSAGSSPKSSVSECHHIRGGCRHPGALSELVWVCFFPNPPLGIPSGHSKRNSIPLFNNDLWYFVFCLFPPDSVSLECA